ncbi:T9SS type A sorting domain-containing protein [Dysgonomonas sp. 520]|uniref:T9SS type A sorting domain-containing protein n=1 Tax=Dysgonomonas sp. 520 TaxID=2302931 RepID=UPI0013D4329B|nr:T9SS type A sorting domain-containing protein [Dysgonomonas sp. 520]NDW09672.1 T9SS C-terminal target domain-containing protein [Dysgonomonas sp. 520]
MKKKIFTIAMMCFGFVSYSNAQEYNLFDPADVDADGWIWFDTQAKIDKYIGLADNENMQYDESGKLIQLVCADFDPYADSEASPTVIGAGTEGDLGGTDAKTGAIKVAPASASMTANGGGFAIKMPSCTSFNIMLSADSKVYARLLGAEAANKRFTDYTVVSAKYSTVFAPLMSAGQKTWTDMHKLNSGNEPYFDYESATTMYAYYQNLTKNDIFIHGMKIMTSTPNSGIGNVENGSFKFDGKTISLDGMANISVYNLQGATEKSVYANSLDVSNLAKGVYVVKAANGEKAYTQKIIIK